MRNISSHRRRIPPLVALTGLVLAGVLSAPSTAADESSLDRVLDAIVANEADTARRLADYEPLFETYLQTVKPDPALGTVPVKDSYFFGRLDLEHGSAVGAPEDEAEKARRAKKRRGRDRSLDMLDDFHATGYKPQRFAQMLTIDRDWFDREHYRFEFLRTEFLGEVRTLVFDVLPVDGKALRKLKTSRFIGRIWVEDRDYHIVRFNGIYSSILSQNFHFDTWRLNMAEGLWLPAYIYTEESEQASKRLDLVHKGQTRIWGYSLERPDAEDEFTKVLIENAQADDRSEAPGWISPVQSARAWENEAEENVLRRLERSGLLAPSGPVDEVLETVVANLEITNDLTIEPEVRARVLLTTPLESFTVGHTIVVSRGLIDVLPDEASLAMVLAHELGHVLSGHELDTRYAFSDQVLVGDREALTDFVFERDPDEEREADQRAMELLGNSPYGEKLAGAGLFLKALTERMNDLPALIRPHFGNRVTDDEVLVRMPEIVAAAPDLDPLSIEQVAALPLGGRVKVDPWTAQIELMTNTRVALLSPREKMPFQITPLMPYLARHDAALRRAAADEAAPGAPAGDDGAASAENSTVAREARSAR